jgi:hypothetical protein
MRMKCTKLGFMLCLLEIVRSDEEDKGVSVSLQVGGEEDGRRRGRLPLPKRESTRSFVRNGRTRQTSLRPHAFHEQRQAVSFYCPLSTFLLLFLDDCHDSRTQR